MRRVIAGAALSAVMVVGVAPFVAVVLYAAVMIGRDMWIALGFTVITMCCIGVGAYLLTSSEDSSR